MEWDDRSNISSKSAINGRRGCNRKVATQITREDTKNSHAIKDPKIF